VKSTDWIRLRITDMYYNGDRFAVYNVYNGIDPELILETPHVDSDSTQRRITDAQAAFKSVGVWSHAEAFLAPGKYHIVIKPRSSPFGGGTAAIRFDRVAQLQNAPAGLIADINDAEICPGYGGYTVIRQRVQAEHQLNVCQLLGLQGVDLDTEDREQVKALTRTVRKCLGEDHVGWMYAVDGNSKRGVLGARVLENTIQVERREASERHQVICKLQE
jgi:hypothetical protein